MDKPSGYGGGLGREAKSNHDGKTSKKRPRQQSWVKERHGKYVKKDNNNSSWNTWS